MESSRPRRFYCSASRNASRGTQRSWALDRLEEPSWQSLDSSTKIEIMIVDSVSYGFDYFIVARVFMVSVGGLGREEKLRIGL